MPSLFWSEFGYVSAWSIMHFLSGYLWCVVFAWAFRDVLPWVHLLLLLIVALLFELLENQKGAGSWMWGGIGYDTTTYSGDTALNAVSDVLFTVLGWTVVRIVVMYTTSDVALGVLLGVAGALFAIFLCLFRIERRIQLGPKASGDAQRPALLLKISSPLGIATVYNAQQVQE